MYEPLSFTFVTWTDTLETAEWPACTVVVYLRNKQRWRVWYACFKPLSKKPCYLTYWLFKSCCRCSEITNRYYYQSIICTDSVETEKVKMLFRGMQGLKLSPWVYFLRKFAWLLLGKLIRSIHLPFWHLSALSHLRCKSILRALDLMIEKGVTVFYSASSWCLL